MLTLHAATAQYGGMKTLALMVGLLVGGCGGLPAGGGCEAGMVGQCDAEQMIWYGLLGETEPPPPVVWVADTCGDGSYPRVTYNGQCLPGLHVWRDKGDEVIMVTDLGQRGRLSETMLPHEWLHAHLQRSTGNGDPEHTSLLWNLEVKMGDMLIERGY